jgi:hypothetical protein
MKPSRKPTYASFAGSRVAFVEKRGGSKPPTPDLMDWGKNRQTNRAFRCAGSTTEEGVIATTAWGESGFQLITT